MLLQCMLRSTRVHLYSGMEFRDYPPTERFILLKALVVVECVLILKFTKGVTYFCSCNTITFQRLKICSEYH